ncbi:response regulator [Oceanobacillus sp. CAU 1775]
MLLTKLFRFLKKLLQKEGKTNKDREVNIGDKNEGGGNLKMQEEILIVDDQPGIRLLLSDILIYEGYRVTTASTGEEALNKLKEKQFDLLMLDYKLPIIDGKEVLKKMEELGIYIPVIVMTGLVENFQMDIEKIPLVKKIMAKPFNVLDIGEEVKRILAKDKKL